MLVCYPLNEEFNKVYRHSATDFREKYILDYNEFDHYCWRDQLYYPQHLPEKVWHTAYYVQTIEKYAEKSVRDQEVQSQYNSLPMLL